MTARLSAQKFRKVILIAAVALASLLGSAAIIIFHADRWRLEADQPRISDAIIVLARRGIDVAVVAPPEEPHPGPWWSNQFAARQSTIELGKTVIYALGLQSH